MNQTTSENFANSQIAEDEELLRLAKLGDQAAFAGLYERYLPAVHKRVIFLVPTQDVEDVVQEVFIALVRSLKSFRGDSKFSTWLRVITNRQIANYYRQNKNILTENELDPDDSQLQGRLTIKQTQSRNKREGNILVQQSLQNLPEHYQEIILMRFVDGLKFQEIAERQEKTLDAVKSLFRRAIEAMRAEIGESHD